MVTLKGKQVVLRPLSIQDAYSMFRWLSDPRVNRFMARKNVSLQDERKRIRLSQKTSGNLEFVIENSKGISIGAIWLHDIENKHKRARFGTIIGEKNYWNKGYGTDAKKTLLRHAFYCMKLHKVYCDVFDFNVRNIAINNKIGFTLEGIKRGHHFQNGKYHDQYFFSFLVNDWKRRYHEQCIHTS